MQVQDVSSGFFSCMQMNAENTLSVLAQVLFSHIQGLHVQAKNIGLGRFMLGGSWCRCALSTDMSPI